MQYGHDNLTFEKTQKTDEIQRFKTQLEIVTNQLEESKRVILATNKRIDEMTFQVDSATQEKRILNEKISQNEKELKKSKDTIGEYVHNLKNKEEKYHQKIE